MVVTTMYVYVVPFLYKTQHPVFFACYFIYGHYLLVMICFNYFSGVYTDSGSVPKVCVCSVKDISSTLLCAVYVLLLVN